MTPVTSSPALTTNSDAMKIVVVSPSPASAWLMVEDAGEVQRERGAESNNDDRHFFRDEQHDYRRDDQKKYVDIVHDECPSLDEG